MTAMSCNWSILLVLLLFIIHTGSSISDSLAAADCKCNDANALNAQTCDTFFRTFEAALLNNGSNLYKLRKRFLASPPELVNVTYFLEYSSDDSCSELSNGASSSACRMERRQHCLAEACDGSSTYLNRTTGTVPLQYGWTRIGVYTFFHPALLNLLQIQLPFAVMRLHAYVSDTPFLWNGHNQLPSINLHLSVSTDNLMCIPSDSQVDGVMKSLTSLVKSPISRYSHIKLN